MSTTTINVSRRNPRPIGVWLLTIYAFIFAGIGPMIVELLFLISKSFRASTDIDSKAIFFSLFITIGVIVTSIAAWVGNPKARWMFVIMVTLHYVLLGFNNLRLVLAGDLSLDLHPSLFGRILRGIVIPALYIWYFNKKGTKEYYLNQ